MLPLQINHAIEECFTVLIKYMCSLFRLYLEISFHEFLGKKENAFILVNTDGSFLGFFFPFLNTFNKAQVWILTHTHTHKSLYDCKNIEGSSSPEFVQNTFCASS